MRNNGAGKTFNVSRAVEEPIDATFELGEGIQKISGKLTFPSSIGIFGTIILLILLIPSTYNLIVQIIDGYLGNQDFPTTELIIISILGLILVLLLALVTTTLIFFIQIKSFSNHLIQRYSIVTNLKNTHFTDSGIVKTKVKGKRKFEKKHVKNPIFAMLDLVEESMHELPQLIRLLKICKLFIGLVLVYLLVSINVKLIFNLNFLFSMTYLEFILSAVALILLIPTLLLLINAEYLIKYIRVRHEIIDSIRFEKDFNIPSGKNQVIRLLNYLIKYDPFIKEYGIENFEAIQNVSISGISGKKYKFSVYFSVLNKNPKLSSRLELPNGKFAVFIKVFKESITLKSLQSFRDAVEDVCEKENVFPLRIIALQWDVEELDEMVYEIVLENPIIMKNSSSHIQIVAEDGEVYSFIPLISYGEGSN